MRGTLGGCYGRRTNVGFEDPAELSGFKRCGTVIRCASFESIQPVGNFRQSAGHDHRTLGELQTELSYPVYVGRAEYDVGFRKITRYLRSAVD